MQWTDLGDRFQEHMLLYTTPRITYCIIKPEKIYKNWQIIIQKRDTGVQSLLKYEVTD